MASKGAKAKEGQGYFLLANVVGRATSVHDVGGKNLGCAFSLLLKSGQNAPRTFMFLAADTEACKVWINAINVVLEKLAAVATRAKNTSLSTLTLESLLERDCQVGTPSHLTSTARLSFFCCLIA
jgi:hypothetical protein